MLILVKDQAIRTDRRLVNKHNAGPEEKSL